MKILIADDHKLVRQLLIRILEDEPNIEVGGEARDGLEAIELSERLKPDILITDLKMPGLDGFVVTRKIK